jgi:hypothetical protein
MRRIKECQLQQTQASLFYAHALLSRSVALQRTMPVCNSGSPKPRHMGATHRSGSIRREAVLAGQNSWFQVTRTALTAGGFTGDDSVVLGARYGVSGMSGSVLPFTASAGLNSCPIWALIR